MYNAIPIASGVAMRSAMIEAKTVPNRNGAT
ncbi:unannotated protein [freshwater metagenome]|uniref:Unannotated protein n=1 Tax=freshwater metagenome TaxID=449393 RepID=A0A6J6J8S6_9ZZZZ